MTDNFEKTDEKLSKEEIHNCSENLKYLIQCVFSSHAFPSTPKDPQQILPNLTISRSTLNNTKRGASISVKTARTIASAFSCYYTGSRGGIQLEDILLNPDKFKDHFPEQTFKMKENDKSSTNMALFTNKLYRGYYMLRNSSYKACMAYFWIFSENGTYSAAMLRGISDFKDVSRLAGFSDKSLSYDSEDTELPAYKFKNITEIKKCFKNYQHEYANSKRISAIHLYLAEHKDIRYSPSCIQINFHTEETVACYSTMYWNINVASMSNQDSYIGGSVLMVDTNEGVRGKDICAFKLGLECVDTLKEKSPLNNAAPQVIAELTPETKNGILLIDNADDANWYRFISEKNFRSDSPDTVVSTGEVREIIKRLAQLEKNYRLRLDDANNLVNILKEMTKSSESENAE